MHLYIYGYTPNLGFFTNVFTLIMICYFISVFRLINMEVPQMATNSTTTKPKYSIDELFGENSEKAQQLMDAAEEKIMLASSVGEIRRIQKMLRAKLRMLRTIEFQRNNI